MGEVLTIAELLAGAEHVEVLDAPDGKSGVRIERVMLGRQPHVVKYVSLADDWIMRVTEDWCLRPLQAWESGVHDALPPCIDHAIVGMGLDDPARDRPRARLAILMRDATADLVPEGDASISLEWHRAFLADMAELHATFWGWTDEIGLLPISRRYLWFVPARLRSELQRADCALPLRLANEGWRRFAQLEPQLDAVVRRLHTDPRPIVRALETTPSTFVHGDWKLGNLGRTASNRTVLLDWAVPGRAPACVDLVHYLMLNRARIPETKEASIDAYREALEARGVVTDPWWERQLALCSLGGMLQFGWEKSLGDGEAVEAERRWWCDRALDGCRWIEP